jgi:hypothetical protein
MGHQAFLGINDKEAAFLGPQRRFGVHNLIKLI